MDQFEGANGYGTQMTKDFFGRVIHLSILLVIFGNIPVWNRMPIFSGVVKVAGLFN